MRWFFLTLAVLFWATGANATTLVSTAAGNINATGTWSVIDTTGPNAYLNSEASSGTPLTTSPVASSTFTPAAETLTAIAVKIASVAASPSGTMTVKLANSTSPGSRECTQTVNVADLPPNASPTSYGGPDGGFIFFSCAASPNGTDAYTITANTSVGSQVSLFSDTGADWSRVLVTTGTKTGGPAAGDKFFVAGVLTGAGTHSAFTVTINTTANINYGNVANTMVDPSIAVGQWGTLAYATTSATNFAAEVAGPMVVYNGGTFTVGTSGSPIPMSASCTDASPCADFTFNTSVEGDTGLTCRNGSTCGSAGQPRTVGKNFVQTHLFMNYSAGAQTSLTVSDDTGWKNGDRIVVAATDQVTNAAHSEMTVLTGDATSSALPISFTFLHPHLGQIISYTSTTSSSTSALKTFPEQAEVILLTRNVRFHGSSDATPGYIFCAPTANCSWDWTEFKWISGNQTNQLGLESETTAGGTWSATNFSLHDAHDAGVTSARFQSTGGGTSGSPVTFQNGVLWNVNETPNSLPLACSFIQGGTTNPNWVIDHITILSTPAQNDSFCLYSYNGQFTNIVCADLPNGGNCLAAQQASQGFGYSINNMGPLTFHSNNNFDTNWSANGISGTIHGIYDYHSYGWFFASQGDNITVDPFYSLAHQVLTGSKGNETFAFRNGFSAGDATAAKPGIAFDEGFNTVYLDNMDLCPTQTVSITTASGTVSGQSLFATCTGNSSSVSPANDVGLLFTSRASIRIVGRNTAFLSSADAQNPGLFGQYFLTSDSSICTDYSAIHECFLTYGIIVNDTTISSGFSTNQTLRLWPIVSRFTASASAGTLTTSGSTYPVNIMSPNMFIFGTTTNFPTGTQINDGTAPNWIINSTLTAPSQTMMGSAFNENCVLSQCRLQSAPLGGGQKVAVNSGGTVTECVRVRESLNTDPSFTFNGQAVAAATYNGDPPRLILRQNPQMGVANDTALATYSASAGTTQQLCGTTPAAPQDGLFEFVVDADMTPTSNAGGFVSVGDWLATGGAQNVNGIQRYFFNGLPADLQGAANGGPTVLP